jgi:hypothetical protein
MAVVVGKLRGKLALEMVAIERLGQIGELVPIIGGSFLMVPVNIEVQVQIVKVNEFSAGKVFGGWVHLEVLGSSPGLGSRAVHIVAAGPWAEGREGERKLPLRRQAGGAARNWDRVAASDSHGPVHSRLATVQIAVTLASLSPEDAEESVVRQGQDEALHEKRPGGRAPHGDLIRLGGSSPAQVEYSAGCSQLRLAKPGLASSAYYHVPWQHLATSPHDIQP